MLENAVNKVTGHPFFGLNGRDVLLDNAASTPPFTAVMNEVNAFLRSYGSIHRGFGERSISSTDRYEEAREKIKRLMGAGSTHDLFLVSNTTDGINRLALILREVSEKTGRRKFIRWLQAIETRDAKHYKKHLIHPHSPAPNP